MSIGYTTSRWWKERLQPSRDPRCGSITGRFNLSAPARLAVRHPQLCRGHSRAGRGRLPGHRPVRPWLCTGPESARSCCKSISRQAYLTTSGPPSLLWRATARSTTPSLLRPGPGCACRARPPSGRDTDRDLDATDLLVRAWAPSQGLFEALGPMALGLVLRQRPADGRGGTGRNVTSSQSPPLGARRRARSRSRTAYAPLRHRRPGPPATSRSPGGR
jgi:hypothetical protein